jgi:hypothetical protein
VGVRQELLQLRRSEGGRFFSSGMTQETPDEPLSDLDWENEVFSRLRRSVAATPRLREAIQEIGLRASPPDTELVIRPRQKGQARISRGHPHRMVPVRTPESADVVVLLACARLVEDLHQGRPHGEPDE